MTGYVVEESSGSQFYIFEGPLTVVFSQRSELLIVALVLKRLGKDESGILRPSHRFLHDA